MAEPNPSQPQPPVKKSTRPPGDGLAGALLRIDELESIQDIHQQRIQELLEQRDALQERCEGLGRKFMAASLVSGQGDAVLWKQIDALSARVRELVVEENSHTQRLNNHVRRIEKLEGK